MILFDTDTLTHFSHGNANVHRKINAVSDEPLAVTVITRYEVLRGRAESRRSLVACVSLAPSLRCVEGPDSPRLSRRWSVLHGL